MRKEGVSLDKKKYRNVSCIEFLCDSKTFRIIDVNDDFENATGYTYDYISKNNIKVEDLFNKEYYDEYLPMFKSDIDKYGRISSILQPVTKFDKGYGKQYFVYCKYSGEHADKIYVRALEMTGYLKSDEQTYSETQKFKMIERYTNELHFDYQIDIDTLFLPPVFKENYNIDTVIKDYFKGNVFNRIIHPDDISDFESCIKECFDEPISGEIDLRTNVFDDDFAWYHIKYVSFYEEDKKTINHIIGRIIAIDDHKRLMGEIESNKAAITKLTTMDLLTNIYNYKHFSINLSNYLAAKEFTDKVSAVIYSDIDNFSYVNAYFGTEAANTLLKEFANLLQSNNKITLCGRVYCDFFVYVIEGNNKEEVTSTVIELYDTFKKHTKNMYPKSDIYISSGVYYLEESDSIPQIVVDNANLARRRSKGNKHQIYLIYNSAFREERIKEQEIATNIHLAIQNGEIEAFLQPKFSLSERKIIGAEALARWRNPDGTYRPPYEFIGILEQIGYIVDLDWEIYRQTLIALRDWINKGYHVVPISVNFSRLHSNYDDFGERIIKMADEYNVPHDLIEIEITESAIAKQQNTMLDNLVQLRDSKFIINMDDFGTGYSSLSFLVSAPIDIVKVDKVFVDQIITSQKNKNYVRQLCELISITGKDVLFEGVETEDQIEFCKACGFDKGQGWIFDKAIPINEFEKKYMKQRDIETA